MNAHPRLWRSAGLRLALVYALLSALSALALVMFLWWATAGLIERQAEAAIRTDAQGLSEQWQQGGVAALQATIEDRLAENVDDDAIYLLADRTGHLLAGNLATWPIAVNEPDTSYELTLRRAGMTSMARVQRFALPDGSRLLIGRDIETRTPLRALLTSALLWSLVLLAVLGLVGGLVMQRLFRRMIASVADTAAAIAQGDLHRRVRRNGRGDEFDGVAETINEMLDRIARLMDGVREVSNSIAHDLRTPIARARARLEDAAAHASGPDELRAAVGRAISDLDNVTVVFDALLRIAEIEAGTRRSAFADLDVTALLADLAELYAAPAEERGLALVFHAPSPLRVHGDRDLIGQAVVNLLDNALKFSPPGGTVRLEAAAAQGSVRIVLQDAGPGIPAADRARATERFFRGEAARQTPGSGLGLALVEAVAHLHGGSLSLEDAAPGLRAVLTLPAVADSATEPRRLDAQLLARQMTASAYAVFMQPRMAGGPDPANLSTMWKVIALAGAVWLVAGAGARGDEPVTVTTDTRAYCATLARRVDSQGAMPPAVRTLWDRGRTMCDQGHVRAGLLQLRQAILLMRTGAE